MLTPFRAKLLLASDRITRWALPGFALFAVASIALQNLIFLALAAWLFGMALRKRWTWQATPLNWPLLLLGAVLLASSLLAGSLNPSLFGLRKVGLMAIFFLTASVVTEPLDANRYLNLFIIGAAICAAGSIVKHLFILDGGRATSFSGDYMAAGGMYMLALTLAFARFLYSSEKNGWQWLGAGLILGAALLFTYTRSSWLGAAVALLLLSATKDWRLPAIGLVLVVVFLFLFPHNPISQRAFSIASKSNYSKFERFRMWGAGLKLVRDQPWLGYGVDNLSEHYGRYIDPAALEKNPPHVHNTELQIALNGGLIALFLFLWWAAVVLRLGWAGWRRNLAVPERAGAALGILAAFAGFLVNGLFEFNFGASQVITIVYFLTGLLPVLALDPKQRDWCVPKQPRFLFLRPRFRGDVLLASMLPRLLKRDFPEARVDLLTEPSGADVARGEPAWDNILVLPRDASVEQWWQMIRRVRLQDYDFVCDLFGNPRTAQLALASGAHRKIGPHMAVWGSVFHIHTEPDRPGARPAWESYLDVLRSLGMRQLSQRPRWEVSAHDLAWVKSFLAERRARAGKIIGIFPGATHPAKRWPLANFMEVSRRAAKELGLKSIFVFGPQEEKLKAEYAQNRGKLSLTADDLTPGQLAALWQACAVVISNDAFPMHMGPAVGTPTLGLFGPGEPEVWFPYASGHRALQEKPDCWPCHLDVCEEMLCWKQLAPEAVFKALEEMLAKPGKKR